MDDEATQFTRWFTPWKMTRADTTPLGWYTLDELRAAFDAGKRAEFDQAVAEIIARSDRIEALLRAPDGPARLTPPAGPVP